jgi:hypothetical protein
LEPREASLPKQSVVIVSQIFTVDKGQLGDLIGTLSKARVRQILDGLKLVTKCSAIEYSDHCLKASFRQSSGRNPSRSERDWIPASAGMTN